MTQFHATLPSLKWLKRQNPCRVVATEHIATTATCTSAATTHCFHPGMLMCAWPRGSLPTNRLVAPHVARRTHTPHATRANHHHATCRGAGQSAHRIHLSTARDHMAPRLGRACAVRRAASVASQSHSEAPPPTPLFQNGATKDDLRCVLNPAHYPHVLGAKHVSNPQYS